jgi:hypothetical protein
MAMTRVGKRGQLQPWATLEAIMNLSLETFIGVRTGFSWLRTGFNNFPFQRWLWSSVSVEDGKRQPCQRLLAV